MTREEAIKEFEYGILHLELRWFYSQHHIVAWQPLPKPYKEESEE